MKSTQALLVALLAVVIPGAVALPHSISTPSLPRYPSAIAIEQDSGNVFVAERDGQSIAVVNTTSEGITRFPVPGFATGINTYSGRILVTTNVQGTGFLLEIDPDNGRVLRGLQVGQGARSPVVDSLGKLAYTCNYFSGDISIVDLESFTELARLPVLRLPSACALSTDGQRLFVSNFLPDGRSDLPVVSAKVSVIDTHSRETIAHIELENGSNALKDIALSPDGRQVLVTHTLGRHQVPTTQLERGWVNTYALSLIDSRSLQVMATVLLDDPDRGAAGPWGIDFSCTGELLFIAHSGTHELSIIDYPGLLEKINRHPDPARINYDLAFLSGLRRRIQLNGVGPRDLIAHGKSVLVCEYFSDSLSILDIQSMDTVSLSKLQLNPGMLITPEHLGEQYFNDATICYQNWQSCSSCHPEGRSDGLNWDLLNDGMGNPKNTKSILYSHFTPPSNATGSRSSAESSVRAGFRYIHFSTFPEESAKAVDAYLKAMTAEPSPFLTDGALSADAQKGRHLFMGKAKCIDCHNGPYFTDLHMYDMQNAGPRDRQSTWDTPTLIENWRSAPYLHDGRAATLFDVVVRENHGNAAGLLDARELELLVEYLKSL